jgi:TldD protein
VQGTRFVTSNMFFVKDERTFASTDGTFTVQNLVRSLPSMNVTAVAADSSDFQSRASAEIAPMGRSWEHVLDADLVARAPTWAEEAVRKLSARSVEPGRCPVKLNLVQRRERNHGRGIPDMCLRPIAIARNGFCD